MSGKTQSYDPGDGGAPWRCGVGIVVFNKQGQVLGCIRATEKKVHFNTDYKDSTLQWPQGGIDEGEDEQTAAYRELTEETGIRPEQVELLLMGPDYTFYQFPDYVLASPAQKYRGQRHRWFAFLLTDATHEFIFDGHHEVEFEAVVWTTLDEVANRVIAFKGPAYAAAANMFAHLPEQIQKRA